MGFDNLFPTLLPPLQIHRLLLKLLPILQKFYRFLSQFCFALLKFIGFLDQLCFTLFVTPIFMVVTCSETLNLLCNAIPLRLNGSNFWRNVGQLLIQVGDRDCRLGFIGRGGSLKRLKILRQTINGSRGLPKLAG